MKKKNNVLSILENTAIQSGIKVIYENKFSVEGYCKVNGVYYLIFNKNSSFKRQLGYYRDVFRKVNIENVYLPPVVRKIIEEENDR